MIASTYGADTLVLAEAQIEVGHHKQVEWLGMTWNIDTIIATAIAAVIVIALAFFVRSRMTSKRPNSVQLFFEAVTTQMRSQIENSMGMKVGGFVLPLAVTLFTFILIANWLSVLPLQYADSEGKSAEVFAPAASDVNFCYALALFVFVCTWLPESDAADRSVTSSVWSRVTSHSWPRSTSSKRSRSLFRSPSVFSATCSQAASWSR